MPDIKITFSQVRDKATQLRGHNTVLTEKLAKIQSLINGLEAQWTSDTSDTIRAKITGMQPRFNSYKEVVESYAKFLDTTAAEYEKTESTLNSNASSQFI